MGIGVRVRHWQSVVSLAALTAALIIGPSIGGAAPAGLVAAYSFDAGVGSVVEDVSGNGNSGSISGAAWTNSGKNKGALAFDGVNDWVTVPDSTSLDLSTGMTVEAWVRPSALGGWRNVAVKERSGGIVYALQASQDASRPAGQVDIDGEQDAVGTAPLPVNAWTHLATTYDGTTLRLFVNGVLADTSTVAGSIPASGGPLRLGGNSVWSEWFRGEIDDVRVYDRPLSASEVQADMATAVGGDAPPADSQPPSAPSGLSVGGQTQTALTLTWNASTDSGGVAGYGLYRGGAAVGATNASTRSYTFSGLSCGTTYTLAVDAVDAAGNRSTQSTASGSTAACAAPAQPTGLVAAYSFDGGAGATLADVSGRGNAGVISGPSWTTAGKYGGALSFDGVNDLVTIQDAASLDLTTGMTLEAWVRPTASTSWRTIVTKEQPNNLVYGLFANADGAYPSSIVSIGANAVQDIARGSAALPLSSWTHLATTYDGSQLRLFVNGSQVGTRAVTGAMPNSSQPLQIGGNRVWREWFQGQIDDLRIYNRSLTQSEIQADMGAPVTPPPAGDAQAPTTPGGLTLGTQTQTALTLSWNASTDNVGVTGYEAFRNGAVAGSTAAGTRTYTFSGLACATTYTLGVEALDAAGNRSARATINGATAACDAAPPPPSPSPPPPGPGPAPTAANLWVDVNGGSCVRQANATAYSDVQACSWNGAYQAARTGDLILVKGGDYGDVNIGPNNSSVAAPGVTYRTASGENVVVRDLENGNIAGPAGGDNISFVGPVTARTFRSDGNDNIVVDGWNVDCNGCVGIQIFHIEKSNNVVVRNSEIQDNTDNSLIWINGTNITFENNRIHDAGLRAGSGAHTECLYAWDVTNLTLKRNSFYNCAVMDVFITGGSTASGGYIENNVFEKPWESTGVVSNTALAFQFRNGGDPSPDPSNWDFRYNTFVGPLNISDENPVGSGGMRVIGNVFLAGAPCGKGNTTYSNNVFALGACGANGVTYGLSTLLAGFVSAVSPGDYRLRSTSVLRDKGSTTTYPANDRAGTARYTGTAPDVGAFEYAGG